MIKMKNKLRT